MGSGMSEIEKSFKNLNINQEMKEEEIDTTSNKKAEEVVKTNAELEYLRKLEMEKSPEYRYARE